MTLLKHALNEAYDHACSMNITNADSLEDYVTTFKKRSDNLDKLELEDSFQKTLDITKAMSSSVRLKIMLFIGLSESTCFCELEPIFGLEQSTLTYHLKLLQRANLITTRKQGKWKIFSLNKNTIENLQSSVFSLLSNIDKNFQLSPDSI